MRHTFLFVFSKGFIFQVLCILLEYSYFKNSLSIIRLVFFLSVVVYDIVKRKDWLQYRVFFWVGVLINLLFKTSDRYYVGAWKLRAFRLLSVMFLCSFVAALKAARPRLHWQSKTMNNRQISSLCLNPPFNWTVAF